LLRSHQRNLDPLIAASPDLTKFGELAQDQIQTIYNAGDTRSEISN